MRQATTTVPDGLPQLLAAIRGERTRQAMADQLHLHYSAVSLYEAGKRMPGPGPLAGYFLEATNEQRNELLQTLGHTDAGKFAAALLEMAGYALPGTSGNGHPPEAD